MQERRASVVTGMVSCFAASAVAAWGLRCSAMVPCHGPIFGLLPSEILLLIWVPISAFCCSRRGVPWYWWLCYGIIMWVVLWPALSSAVCSSLAGRRPWRANPNGMVKLFGFSSYVLIASLLGGVARERLPPTASRLEEGE